MAAIWKHGLAAALLAISTLPAQSAVTEWIASEGGRMRIAALAEGEAGAVTAILQIDPEPGWKTYWRDPGDAGVAPTVDLAGTENLELRTIRYPVPEIGHDEGGRFHGYPRPVSLVLDLRRPDPSRASVLNAGVMIGLCKSICLPFQATFSLPVGDISNPVADEFMAIRMAGADLPEAPSPAFGVTATTLSADGKTFEVTARIPGDGLPEVAVAASAGLLLGQPEMKLTGPGTVTIRYPVRRMPVRSEEAAITLLMKSAGRAMETSLAVR
jgi:DsbC/DsbD-like thiol-disulfide interchange protein